MRHTTGRVLVALAATAGLALIATPAMAADDDDAVGIVAVAGEIDPTDEPTDEPTTEPTEEPTTEPETKPAIDNEGMIKITVGPGVVKTESKAGVQTAKPKAKAQDTLPDTGSSTAPILGAAAALLLAGTAAVAVRRTRQTS